MEITKKKSQKLIDKIGPHSRTLSTTFACTLSVRFPPMCIISVYRQSEGLNAVFLDFNSVGYVHFFGDFSSVG